MKSIITFLLFILLGRVVSAHTYVVCVGITDYPGHKNDLRVSANDARTIQTIFTSNGNASVRCLTNREATASIIKKTMIELFGKANADDAIFFYFSGHGVPGAFICYDRSLHYSEVVEMMSNSKARRKMVIADACFAGQMRSTKNKDKDQWSHNDVMFFLSSRTKEKSMETPYQNSLFTIFLERGLRGGADADRNRIISARELYDFVHSGVVRASSDRQHPVMWGRFNKDMIIIKW